MLWTETSCYGPWLCVTFTLRFEWNLIVPVGGLLSVRQNKSRVASNPRMEYSCTVGLVVKKRQRGIKLPSLTGLENVIKIIIMIFFHCGLMVHITDTRTQKVFSCTSAHITETVLAHDQHWEEQNNLSSPQLYRHSQKRRKWITIQ